MNAVTDTPDSGLATIVDFPPSHADFQYGWSGFKFYWVPAGKSHDGYMVAVERPSHDA